MPLDLGELSARLTVDDSQADQGIEGFSQKLGGLASKAGPVVAGAGLAVGAAFVASTMQAIDNEAIADVAAAQYANPETAKMAGDIAGKLYAGGWGEGLADVNDSVKAVMSSIGEMDDASAEDIQNMTAMVMDLSKVMGIEVPRAAQLVGQSVQSGLAKDATQGVDLLTKALQIVPTNLREDLMDAVDEYGPFLSSIGIKGEQAFGLLAQAAGKGMYGIDKTGDALKEFTIRATDGSKVSTEAYKAIGLNAEQMSRDVASGGDKAAGAFQKVVSGLLGIDDPAKQAQTAIALFGTPLEDLNVSEIPKFLTSLDLSKAGMGGFEGSAKQLSATVNDNAATAIESFKRQAQTAFVQVLGGQILPVVKNVATFMATNFGPALKQVGDFVRVYVMPAVRAFGSWMAQAIPVIRQMASVVLAEARKQLAGVAASFKANEPQIRQFISWIRQAAQFVMSNLVPILRTHLVASLKVTAASIKVAIAVVTQFVGAVKGIVAAVRGTISAVKTAWGALPGWMKSAIASLPQSMYNAGKLIMEMLGRGIMAQAEFVKSQVRGIVGGISSLIPGSPVREGPLKVLNNGHSGREAMRMFSRGVVAEGPNVKAAFRRAVDVAPQLAGGMVRRGVAGADGRRIQAVMSFEGSSDPIVRALMKAFRLELREMSMRGALG